MIQVSEIVEVVNITVDEITETVNITVTEQNIPISLTVSEMGLQGLKGDAGGSITKVSGEAIPSFTPVVLIDNIAYKLDASNPLHQFAFVGFSENGTSIGQNCNIKQIGEVYLFGWGLIPNQHYLAGTNGTLITKNLSSSNFTKVIGYAVDSNTLQIIKDSITINK